MKRPSLTRKRVEGLVLIAERARPLVKARAGRGNLFRLERAENERILAALDFVDQMAVYERERERACARRD